MQTGEKEKVREGELGALLAERDDEVTRLRRMLQVEVLERPQIEAQRHRMGKQLEMLTSRLLVSAHP